MMRTIRVPPRRRNKSVEGLQSADAPAIGRSALTPIQRFTRGELIFDTSEGKDAK